MDLVEKAKRLALQFAEAATGDDQLRRLSDSTWSPDGQEIGPSFGARSVVSAVEHLANTRPE